MAIPNRGPELVGVNVAFMATAFLANALRCIVRVKMVKAFGVDDWLMVASMVSELRLIMEKCLLTTDSFSLSVMVFPRQ